MNSNKNIFYEQQLLAMKILDVYSPEVKKKLLSFKPKYKCVFPGPDKIYSKEVVIEKDPNNKINSFNTNSLVNPISNSNSNSLNNTNTVNNTGNKFYNYKKRYEYNDYDYYDNSQNYQEEYYDDYNKYKNNKNYKGKNSNISSYNEKDNRLSDNNTDTKEKEFNSFNITSKTENKLLDTNFKEKDEPNDKKTLSSLLENSENNVKNKNKSESQDNIKSGNNTTKPGNNINNNINLVKNYSDNLIDNSKTTIDKKNNTNNHMNKSSYKNEPENAHDIKSIEINEIDLSSTNICSNEYKSRSIDMNVSKKNNTNSDIPDDNDKSINLNPFNKKYDNIDLNKNDKIQNINPTNNNIPVNNINNSINKFSAIQSDVSDQNNLIKTYSSNLAIGASNSFNKDSNINYNYLNEDLSFSALDEKDTEETLKLMKIMSVPNKSTVYDEDIKNLFRQRDKSRFNFVESENKDKDKENSQNKSGNKINEKAAIVLPIDQPEYIDSIGNILFKKASKCMFFKSFEKCGPNIDNIIFEKEISQLNNCYFQFYNKEEDKVNI